MHTIILTHVYVCLQSRFLRKYPNAAGFTFQTELFILSWAATNPGSQLVISQYRNRTKPLWDRRKSILVTDRVHPQSVWTHGFNGVHPHKRYCSFHISLSKGFFAIKKRFFLVIRECPSSVVRRASSVVNNFVVTTLQPIILIQSSLNLLRMFILIISRTSSNMGWVGSKSRSLGQIFVKSCYHSRGHNFDPIFIKLAQNAYIYNISDKFQYGWGRVKM